MTLDLIYLNEAKRIRMEYLTNMGYIVMREDEMKVLLDEVESIQNGIDENVNIPDDVRNEKLFEINHRINKIKTIKTKIIKL